jgi:hypothetical protein
MMPCVREYPHSALYMKQLPIRGVNILAQRAHPHDFK